MRRSNPERERHERLGPIMSGGGRDECRRRDREHIQTTTPTAAPQRRVMQAYPAYPNSTVIGSSPMSIPGQSSGVSSRNANGSMTLTISEGPRARLDDIPRSNEGSEVSERQLWRGRREIAPHTAPSSGRDIGESVPRSISGNGSGRSIRPALPSSMMPPQSQTGSGGRERVRMKRSERDERSGRRSSKDDVMRQKLLESNMESLNMEHFVVDKPVNRRSRPNINPNPNQKLQRMTVIEPTHKPTGKPKVVENRPQTMAVVGTSDQVDVNNNMAVGFPSTDTEKVPSPTQTTIIAETKAPMTKGRPGQMTGERSVTVVSDPKLNSTKPKVSKERVAHPFARNIKKTPSLEFNPSLEQLELPERCSKCQIFSKKLKTQTQSTKNLQRQNGCLESIITQKRNLVEQLTRQVRGLMKENFQLAKGAGLEPGQGSLIPTDSMSATTTTAKGQSTSDLLATSSTPILPTRVTSEERSASPPGGNSAKTKTTRSSSRNRTTGASRSKKFGSKNPDMMEEYDKQIEALQNSNEALQKRAEKSHCENLKTSRFLTDLLYTLNARGYESITDFEGSIVDLYRCRGDHLLDLKGRDARVRTPVKRMTPQETLLKAVIGSQEKLIQNLFVQLDSRTRENLLGSRLSSISAGADGKTSDPGRNAALEGEILALVCLIEGACQRNPEVFHILQDQALSDRETKHSSGMNANNVVIEAVLDRCQRMLCTGAPPTSPRLRSRGKDSSNSPSPRSGTPPPYHSRSGSNRSGGIRQIQSDDQAYQTAPNLNEMNQEYVEHSLIGSSKYNQGLRPMSRSNLRTMTAGGFGSGSGSGRQRPISPPGRNSSGSGPDVSPKRRPSLPRCRFCGMKFPSHFSLAEINSHLELHNS